MTEIINKEISKKEPNLVKWARDPDAPNPRENYDAVCTTMLFKDLDLNLGDLTNINLDNNWEEVSKLILAMSPIIEMREVYVRDNPKKEFVLTFKKLKPAYDVRMVGYMFMTADQYKKIGITSSQNKEDDIVDIIFNHELKYYLNYLNGNLIKLEWCYDDDELEHLYVTPDDLKNHINLLTEKE